MFLLRVAVIFQQSPLCMPSSDAGRTRILLVKGNGGGVVSKDIVSIRLPAILTRQGCEDPGASPPTRNLIMDTWLPKAEAISKNAWFPAHLSAEGLYVNLRLTTPCAEQRVPATCRDTELDVPIQKKISRYK